MDTGTWILVVTALAGGLGGFLARAVPNGVGKLDVADAPTEADAFVSALAGAVAALATLLATDGTDAIVLLGTGKDLDKLRLTGGDLVQAFTAGLVGIKWLINHQDAQTLRAAVAESAAHPESAATAAAAAGGKPREVLHAARGN